MGMLREREQVAPDGHKMSNVVVMYLCPSCLALGRWYITTCAKIEFDRLDTANLRSRLVGVYTLFGYSVRLSIRFTCVLSGPKTTNFVWLNRYKSIRYGTKIVIYDPDR